MPSVGAIARKAWAHQFALLLLLAGAVLLSPSFANAAAAATSAPYDGVRDTCRDIRAQIAQEDNDGIWLTESIVTCIKAVIVGSSKYSVTGVFEVFLDGIYSFFEPIIRILLTIAVILFGVGLATGLLEKPSRDSFMVLVKLSMVIFFVQTSTAQWVFKSSIDALDGMTEMVFTFGKGPEMDGRCKIQDGDVLWDRVDCMFDVLIGIKQDIPDAPGAGAKNQVSPDKSGISRGMMHFFFANMASSGMGAMVIGALGMYTIFAFVFAVIKALHTYLAAVLGLAFVLVLIPMFVPMLLFKTTKNYFEKWYRIAISFVLQPMLLFGFLSLMMIAFDMVLVSGNNSVLRMIIGDEAETMVLSDALEQADIYNTQEMMQQGIVVSRAGKVARQFTNNLTGMGKGIMATPEGTSLRDGGPIAGTVMSYLPMDGVDYNRLAQKMGDAADDAEAKERLAYAAIIMALTVFVFLSMLNYIPTMAADLAGGVYEVPNLHEMVGQNFLGANQAEKMAANLSGTVRRKLKNGDAMKQFKDMVGWR